MNEPRWRKATIRFLVEQKHNTRVDDDDNEIGCDVIHVGEIREIYFYCWEPLVEGQKQIIHVTLGDLIDIDDNEFEIITMGEPEEMHPMDRVNDILVQSEKLVENIVNVAAE